MRHLVAASGVALVGTIWYVLWSTVGAGPAAIAYLAMPLSAAICGHSVLVMLRHARLSPVARRFWKFLLISFGFLTTGYAGLAFAAFRDTSTLPSLPIPAAALVGAGFFAAMWAVGRVPLGIGSRTERWKQWLDRTIAFLGCSTVLFNFGLAPMITAAEPWSTQAMVLIGLSFLLAVGGITKVSYIAGGPV